MVRAMIQAGRILMQSDKELIIESFQIITTAMLVPVSAVLRSLLRALLTKGLVESSPHTQDAGPVSITADSWAGVSTTSSGTLTH